MARTFELITPLGADVLLFHRMHAREELSRLSEFQIDALSIRNDINLDEILGKNVTVKVELAGGQLRHFNGYVTRFAQAGMHGRYHAYQATVRPWLWFLTRRANCRIFQQMTVPDILKKVFNDHSGLADTKFELTGSYRTWDYCVQYRETDFNFVSRLMEQEGMYYYFKYQEGRNTFVVADSYSAHSALPGCEQLPYIPQERMTRPEQERISTWSFGREIQPGRYVLDDYDATKPSVELQTKTNFKRKHVHADYEFYDYPGEYLETKDGEQYVRTRIEELHAQFELAQGQSNARGLSTGYLVKLTGQPRVDQNREYLVVSAQHQLDYSEYESMEEAGTSYDCNFTMLNSRQPYRPARTTPKPFVQGPQTAVVVGPSGDEIYTDKYGRVKVQFHWDRVGEKNENSSCWIRVSHPWAGKNWGMVAIPRIGQEVIVDFLEGDPDNPIITGRVYNAEQMPPYALPANMTQTGILSRSSKGGSGANANELRFEDKKGAEQVYLHAEKNQDISVENDETHSVGHDRTKTIDNDETSLIKHDRTETVGNNETITIGVNRTEKVGVNESITIGSNRTKSVGASETASVALQRTHLVGVNETIGIGGAQEVGIGGFQAIAVGAYQTTNVGAYQSNNIGVNQSTNVGAAQSVTVGAAQTVKVGANQSVSVGANQSESVGGNASKSVKGNDSLGVDGNRSADVKGDDSTKIGKNLVIDAGDSVTIKTGSASISMKKDGTIVIKGKDITVEGSGKINIKADSDIVMKGSKILQN
ncbi:type VI secretion system secreted protein VgrG [Nitrosospira sp. Nsp5]|uniref:Type VI secretion system secreted protein VgrG n=1 Tax=Nitrosospira multiformis TaxID=1231 RepID=A0ABY0TDU2_9PROT|nr:MULTISPECIES: type VI secretion system tip protein TssI/VgrG [Nitrosospira]PTR08967.1 type VI secretion system secreted protein VgrG [Nitrosospira sp. Nsp5]SDQ68005.1 type VI secretion system secreted protein VgrG [Nitrosospira multiformis]